MPFGPASLLGVERFSQDSEAPVELLPGATDENKEEISLFVQASSWQCLCHGERATICVGVSVQTGRNQRKRIY